MITLAADKPGAAMILRLVKANKPIPDPTPNSPRVTRCVPAARMQLPLRAWNRATQALRLQVLDDREVQLPSLESVR